MTAHETAEKVEAAGRTIRGCGCTITLLVAMVIGLLMVLNCLGALPGGP